MVNTWANMQHTTASITPVSSCMVLSCSAFWFTRACKLANSLWAALRQTSRLRSVHCCCRLHGVVSVVPLLAAVLLHGVVYGWVGHARIKFHAHGKRNATCQRTASWALELWTRHSPHNFAIVCMFSRLSRLSLILGLYLLVLGGIVLDGAQPLVMLLKQRLEAVQLASSGLVSKDRGVVSTRPVSNVMSCLRVRCCVFIVIVIQAFDAFCATFLPFQHQILLSIQQTTINNREKSKEPIPGVLLLLGRFLLHGAQLLTMVLNHRLQASQFFEGGLARKYISQSWKSGMLYEWIVGWYSIQKNQNIIIVIVENNWYWLIQNNQK